MCFNILLPIEIMHSHTNVSEELFLTSCLLHRVFRTTDNLRVSVRLCPSGRECVCTNLFFCTVLLDTQWMIPVCHQIKGDRHAPLAKTGLVFFIKNNMIVIVIPIYREKPVRPLIFIQIGAGGQSPSICISKRQWKYAIQITLDINIKYQQ